MVKNMRKTVLGAAVAAACCLAGPAAAAPGVLFDVNGAAGPNTVGVDQFVVTTFDWAPGNTLITNTVPEGDAVLSRILMQARLGSLLDSGFSYGTSAFS